MIVDTRRVSWLSLLALACLAGSSGCANALGPERMPISSVAGRVTENGRPVRGGWIEFVPIDGTVGKLRSARLNADGTFQADKVSVGLNLVRLVNLDISDDDAKYLFGAFHSPIRRTIPAHAADAMNFELVDEWNVFWKEYARQRSVAPRPQDALR
jgi:hypothetical protein